MKTCCILLLFTLTSFEISDAATEAVRDNTGKDVRAGVEYYILPVGGIAEVPGSRSGLALGNGSCPQYVVQDRTRELSNGLPLTFSPVDPKKGVIRLSTDLNIKFSAVSTCVQSTVWTLSAEVKFGEQEWFVKTGGVEGNPGQETLDNWFKIEKYAAGDDYYKLVFCPTVCNTCTQVLCSDIGIYVDEFGARRLALVEDVAWRIMLKKVFGVFPSGEGCGCVDLGVAILKFLKRPIRSSEITQMSNVSHSESNGVYEYRLHVYNGSSITNFDWWIYALIYSDVYSGVKLK